MLFSSNHIAFIKGKFILESVNAAHEVIHEVARKHEKEVILKLDYEKAYDIVDNSFLEEMFVSWGFGNTWIIWVLKAVKGVLFDWELMMKSVDLGNLGSDLDKRIHCLPCFLI